MRAGIVCLATALVTVTAGAATPELIVARFFPDELKTTRGGEVPADDRLSTFAIGDLNHDGSHLIVAVYSNGTHGGVSVLSPIGDGALVTSVIPGNMSGKWPKVSLVDLDHDGHPEILATMSSPRGYGVTWVYKWTGVALSLTGPIEHQDTDDYFSDLVNIQLVAIDGDGPLSVVDEHSGRSCCDDDGSEKVSEELRLFRWTNGALVQDSTLDGFLVYGRGKGVPAFKTDSFSAAKAGPRDFIVVNGDYDGSNRVASAEIRLNGQTILQPSALSEKVGCVRITAPVTAGDNQLSVKVNGKPGGDLSVLVRPPS